MTLTGAGRLRLRNPREAVRGLELTLTPKGGPVEIEGVRVAPRAKGFTVQYYQASPTEPAKLLIVSLEGKTLVPGHGTVVKLRTKRGARHARLRLTDIRAAN